MPISSLLIHASVISLRQLTQALERQVLRGGHIDTNLLELGIKEDALLPHLARSRDLDPAPFSVWPKPPEEVLLLLPFELVFRYNLVPLCIENGRVYLLACENFEASVLQEICTLFDVACMPVVVPEFRVHEAIERYFQIPMSPRSAALAARNPQTPPSEEEAAQEVSWYARMLALLREGKPLLHPDQQERVMAAQQPLQDLAMKPSSSHSLRALQAISVAAAKARSSVRVEAVLKLEEEPPAPEERVSYHGDLAAALLVQIPAQVETISTVSSEKPSLAAEPQEEAVFAEETVEAADNLEHFATKLERADTRDVIFRESLLYLAKKAPLCLLMQVQGETLLAKQRYYQQALSAVENSTLPLSALVSLRNTVKLGAFQFGVVPSEANLQRFFLQLGAKKASAFLAIPIVLKERTIALLLAIREDGSFSSEETSDAPAVGTLVSRALLQLLQRQKHKPGPKNVTEAAQEQLEVLETTLMEARPSLLEEIAAAAKVDPSTVANASKAAQVQSAVTRESKQFPAYDPRGLNHEEEARERDLRRLLQIVDKGWSNQGVPATTTEMVTAIEGLVPYGDHAIQKLAEIFPGHRPPKMQDRAMDPIEGGVIRAMLRFGDKAIPTLQQLAENLDDSVRFYATWCLASMRTPSVLRTLYDRLFDADETVYQIAASGLHRLSKHTAFEEIRSELRKNITHQDQRTRSLAIKSIAALRLVELIPALIDALSVPHIAQQVHVALMGLTFQDWKLDAFAWRVWYQQKGNLPREAWLVDALSHRAHEVRRAAARELFHLTGQDFDYDPSAGAEERKPSVACWEAWLTERLSGYVKST